jgi:hypothetical protein
MTPRTVELALQLGHEQGLALNDGDFAWVLSHLIADLSCGSSFERPTNSIHPIRMMECLEGARDEIIMRQQSKVLYLPTVARRKAMLPGHCALVGDPWHLLRAIRLSHYGACWMPVKSTQASPCLYIWDWDDGNRLEHQDQPKGEVLD